MPVNPDALLAAEQAGPSLDPQSLYGVSQSSPDPSLAAENSMATHAYGRITTAVSTLRKHDAGTQRNIWKHLSDDEQRMYQAVGYKPPKEHHGSSLFGSALHVVGTAVSKPLGAVARSAQEAVSKDLHALGAPLRQVQHAYRSAALLSDKNRWSPGTPAQWAKAWRESEHGERTFLPSRDAALNQKYGDDVAGIARRIASGESPDEMILALPEDERQAFAQRLNDETKIKDAVQEFQDAKISFGRRVVGHHLMESDPALAHKMSGALDAVGDVAADPVVWGGKIAKAAEYSRYLVGNGARLGEILDKPGATRMLDSMSGALSKGGAGELIRRHPQFTHIAQQLVDEHITTTAELKEWFQGQAGLAAIMDGRVGGMAPHSMFMKDPGAAVPHLSRFRAAAIPAKESLAKVINFNIEHHSPVPRALESVFLSPLRSLKRITTLRVPLGEKINPGNADALLFVQRTADYALPRARANELVSEFAAANGDRGKQFGIWKGLIGEVMDATHVPESYKNSLLSQAEHAESVHAYGVGDSILIDGAEQKAGFTIAQIRDHGWAVPDYREMRMQADRQWLNQRLYGTVNGEMASGFMRIWKPAQLLRIGFPIRTAGEELVAAMLREGPIGLIRGRLAVSSLNEGAVSPIHPLSAIAERMTRHLPKSVVDAIETPGDFVGEVLGDRARRAFRGVEGKLAGKRYVEAARAIHAVVPDALAEEISAVHQHGAGFLSDGPTAARYTREGTKVRPALLRPDGTYKDYGTTEDLFTNMWHKNLDDYAADPLMKVAFAHAGAGEQAQIEAVLEKLSSNEFAAVRKWSARSSWTQDGRVVGDAATEEEALRDWARVVVDNANHVTTDSTGQRFQTILDSVQRGTAPDLEHLNQVPHELRPSTVSGPRLMPVYGEGKWAEMQANGFNYLGRMMNWIAREPMFVHNMATSLKEVQATYKLYEEAAGTEHAVQHINEIAFQRALNKTIPFIHDPEVRSQFAEDARNLSPFLFAQEQFFKRMARTMVHSPEGFREAQLTMMGLRHSGFVKKDDQGNDYFMYPGVNLVQSALTNAVEKFTGHKVSLPIPVGFSGQVRFATPGTERIGAPSFGPLVAIPMRALASRFPELTELEQEIVGERGAGRSYWEQVVPSSLARLAHTFVDNPESSPQMHSAVLQAIQYMEATGHGLPDTASPIEQEDYIARVKSWARVLMFTRTLFGFSVPAAPELQLDPTHLHSELTKLMKQLPVDQAIAEFMRRHPDATPYTVFQSKSDAGAPLPATEDTLKFMNKHGAFLREYPQAGAWFLPQTTGDFSIAAYREQLALELRHRKGTEEFYKDIKFAEAAQDYFDTRDGRDRRLEAARGNRALTAQINQQWSKWSSEYLNMHPLFEESLLSPESQLRRKHAISQLGRALNDPNLPDTPQNDLIRNMVDTYDGYKQRMSQYQGRRDHEATSARAFQTQQFVDWAHQYVAAHPEVRGLYDRVYRLEVGDN